MRQAAQDAARELGRILRVREPRDDDREFVAAEPGHIRRQRVLRRPHFVLTVAAGRAEPERDLLEQLVARLMTQGVVDAAEVIEIDEERRHQLAGRPRVLERPRQALLVREPVGQAGQAVVVGERLHLLQHPRVGERHRHLVGQPAELQPLVRSGAFGAAIPDGQDADQLPLEAKREHEDRPRPEPKNRPQVGRVRAVRNLAPRPDPGHRAGPARPPSGDRRGPSAARRRSSRTPRRSAICRRRGPPA